MLKYVDRTLAVLLMLGGVGHTLGSFKAFGEQPVVLLWSLCASVLVLLLGVLNLLRSWRPGDRTLAWIVAAGTACWLVASIAFGQIIHKPLDPRPLIFVVLCIGLIGFSLRAAIGPTRVD